MTYQESHFFIWIAAAYLLGSVPTGLLLGKLYGIDVRRQGSGNIGATNLYRTVGRKVGVMTLVGDCLKGIAPVLLARQFGLSGEQIAWIGLAAFCGHVFSIFLKFKGGKGVATALGVFLALSPLAVLVALILFVLLMLKWRYVSLGSVCAAAVMPLAVALLSGGRTLTLVTFLIGLIVIVRHLENIRRLLAGTENKFKA
ncbi:glycerol-3-phosphate 1-O-acyltransferase PlsY [Pelotalea chapellei]|uniref:Glycerol-3-phosphate acyltransferase n=1 Tax=Pelotalea chapellei TaxID=44671 RepID=A0ABS5UAD3_9BACT|nr:glycerol-3-phosphate 1-O-acyltransferase PlsY [Pelotalea chapellei]MBT1072637.1 glycerol-3-phosphate 1-O-acyltransferase PlsY [Pelotalea chapellei]